jgi:hypothetical protein
MENGSRAAATILASMTLASIALAACGGSEPPPAAPPPATVASAPPPPASSAAATTPAPAQTQEEAHKLVVLAASCWFGGLWADAMGEQDQAKQAGIEARCHEIERRTWNTEDQAHFEQLRALEQNAVSDVVAAVDLATRTDSVDGPRRDTLVKLTQALADAVRETTVARRAGDRVKRDLDREPDKLTGDEVDAVVALRAHAKLEALLKLDAGDLSKEANALGLLCALDRVDVARGLPKHLKFYATADTFQLLFGVAQPDVPQDASKKLVPGTWLKFLSDTAAAAGHPVPDKAKTPRQRDALAWAGMLQGFGEKLQADADGVAPSTDLAKVVTTTLHRLEAEYSAQQAAEATATPKNGGPKPPAKKP